MAVVAVHQDSDWRLIQSVAPLLMTHTVSASSGRVGGCTSLCSKRGAGSTWFQSTKWKIFLRTEFALSWFDLAVMFSAFGDRFFTKRSVLTFVHLCLSVRPSVRPSVWAHTGISINSTICNIAWESCWRAIIPFPNFSFTVAKLHRICTKMCAGVNCQFFNFHIYRRFKFCEAATPAMTPDAEEELREDGTLKNEMHEIHRFM